MGIFSKDIGIDLGTANTLVYVSREGIVLREPSVVAKNLDTGEYIDVGTDAKNMIGRTPGNLVAIRPLKDGVIADFEVTQFMISEFIRKAMKKRRIGKPRIVVCVPYGVTPVERRAVEESVRRAGAKAAYLIEEPIAAAMGAGLNISEASGSMVVDIGGGTSEVAVISLGGIVVCNSIRVAGDSFDEAIITYIKKEFSLLIGDTTAEKIKMTIGCAKPTPKEETMDVRGRDLVTGLPVVVHVSTTHIAEALREPVHAIVETIKYTLEKTPPELSSDIFEKGIMLTGGGALLRNLDSLIMAETGINVIVAEYPLDCVVNGAGQIIEKLDELKNKLSTGA
jgi:rod shape-determining protein MreB and related proteins